MNISELKEWITQLLLSIHTPAPLNLTIPNGITATCEEGVVKIKHITSGHVFSSITTSLEYIEDKVEYNFAKTFNSEHAAKLDILVQTLTDLLALPGERLLLNTEPSFIEQHEMVDIHS